MESEKDDYHRIKDLWYVDIHSDDIEKLPWILKITIDTFTRKFLPIKSKGERRDSIERMFEECYLEEWMPPHVDVFHENKTSSKKNLVKHQ